MEFTEEQLHNAIERAMDSVRAQLIELLHKAVMAEVQKLQGGSSPPLAASANPTGEDARKLEEKIRNALAKKGDSTDHFYDVTTHRVGKRKQGYRTAAGSGMRIMGKEESEGWTQTLNILGTLVTVESDDDAAAAAAAAPSKKPRARKGRCNVMEMNKDEFTTEAQKRLEGNEGKWFNVTSGRLLGKAKETGGWSSISATIDDGEGNATVLQLTGFADSDVWRRICEWFEDEDDEDTDSDSSDSSDSSSSDSSEDEGEKDEEEEDDPSKGSEEMGAGHDEGHGSDEGKDDEDADASKDASEKPEELGVGHDELGEETEGCDDDSESEDSDDSESEDSGSESDEYGEDPENKRIKRLATRGTVARRRVQRRMAEEENEA